MDYHWLVKPRAKAFEPVQVPGNIWKSSRNHRWWRPLDELISRSCSNFGSKKFLIFQRQVPRQGALKTALKAIPQDLGSPWVSSKSFPNSSRVLLGPSVVHAAEMRIPEHSHNPWPSRTMVSCRVGTPWDRYIIHVENIRPEVEELK